MYGLIFSHLMDSKHLNLSMAGARQLPIAASSPSHTGPQRVNPCRQDRSADASAIRNDS